MDDRVEAEGEDGWDGMDDAMTRWETATRTVRR